MIGKICLWIMRKALEHDDLAFGRIIGQAYIGSSTIAYATTIQRMQNRIVEHWGYCGNGAEESE